MAHNKLRDLVKASNPVSSPDRLLPNDEAVRALFAEVTHRAGNPPMSADLLDTTVERRRDMQTQKQPRLTTLPPRRPRGRRWLIPAFAGVVAVVALVVAVVLLSGNESTPDVANPTAAPAAIPESTVLTPLEVGEALNRATRDGDWEAARALYADDATYLEVGGAPVPMSGLATGDNFNFTYDWDGDGTYSIFDREAGYLMNEYVAGVEDRFSCVQADSTTVVCDIVSVGYRFLDGGPVEQSNTYTVVDGRITHLTWELTVFVGFGEARGLKIEYQDWVRAERSEANVDEALFAFLGTPLVVPETVETHRQLIAEWKAQR